MFAYIKYLSTITLLICITQSNGRNYCNSSICTYNTELCKFQSDSPARHCKDLENLIKTDEDKKAILDKINHRRNKVAAGELKSYPAAANMVKLEWNSKLEQAAQRWANQCVKSSSPELKDACRDFEGVSVGQNIASVFGESPGLMPTALVDVWYMELLNNNGSILDTFRESSEGGPQYEAFTQLVWAYTREVGCGGVKFKERLEDLDSGKNRTVYRLVCNFSPSGNRENHSVYTQGVSCSDCPNGTSSDPVYHALCSTPSSKMQNINKTDVIQQNNFLRKEKVEVEEVRNTSDPESDLENYTPFDYFSHLHEFTRQAITVTTTPKPECKDVLAVDDFIDLLRKRLSNDHIFKELVQAIKTTQAVPDTNFTDSHVKAFISKIYSKKEPSTTTKSTENELLNSTLLVDLVEAVIFRSGEKTSTNELEDLSTYPMSDVNPVKIQAELGEIQENEDFTGHYFFPEDNEENFTTEVSEAYYDATNPAIADVILEIEDIKKSTMTRNFLDDILDLESLESSESSTPTTTTGFFMSPDLMISHKSGHEVMKKFLEDIKEKTSDM